MSFRWSITACVLALLVFSSSASATGEFEPNDTRGTATGPLEGGKTYSATFETENDVDWYLFYVKTYSQMDFSATMTKSCGSHAGFELRDLDGKPINFFSAGSVNQTNHLLLTLSPGRYYFEVTYDSECPKDTYSFQIDPAAAITPNRECGEAIVSKEAVGPQLAKVAGELSKNSEKLAKPSEEVQADEASLAVLEKHWEKFLVKWNASVRRLARNHRIRGYVKRRKMRSLVASKRKTNLRLKAQEDSAKRKLASARAAQAKVLEQRTSLESVEAQSKSTLSQAETQIAAHC
jgi:hypothetical protein